MVIEGLDVVATRCVEKLFFSIATSGSVSEHILWNFFAKVETWKVKIFMYVGTYTTHAYKEFLLFCFRPKEKVMIATQEYIKIC